MALLPPAPAHHSSPKTSRLGEMQREEMRALIFFFFGGVAWKEKENEPKRKVSRGVQKVCPPPSPLPRLWQAAACLFERGNQGTGPTGKVPPHSPCFNH